MKFITLIFLILLLSVVAASAAITISKVPIDTEQKLKAYADNNLKDKIKYSNFEILKIKKFDKFVVIHFKADGKEQRWFKPIKSFDRLIK